MYEIICLTNIDCTKVRLEQGWDFALWFFRANRSFFVSEIATRSWLLFFKEQQEQFAHSHSFLQSNESYLLPLLFTNSKESNLLTVALFYRATRAIRSRCSLQKSNEVKSDRRASLLCIKGDKNGENEFFWANRSLFERKSVICSQKLSKSLMLLFLKRERANSQPWIGDCQDSPTNETTFLGMLLLF